MPNHTVPILLIYMDCLSTAQELQWLEIAIKNRNTLEIMLSIDIPIPMYN